MKTIVKKLPKLTRKGKIVRNLAVCALVIAAIPWVTDWPTNNSEEVFRRVERQALLSPSEILLQWGEAFLVEGEDWIAVGKVDKYTDSWKPFQKKIAYINNVVPKGEPAVVALPDTEGNVLWVAVHGVPEEVVTGELSLTVSGVDTRGYPERVAEEETFTARADRDEAHPEWMFFPLTSHGDHPGLNRTCLMEFLWWELTLGEGVAPYPYTLKLYDGDGEVVEEISANLPRSNRFLYSDFWV
jgi:hypothetical protein